MNNIKILGIIIFATIFYGCISNPTQNQRQEVYSTQQSQQKQIPQSPQYKISIAQNDNQYGEVKVNTTSASEGNSVILTINALSFYQIKSIIVKDEQQNEIKVIGSGLNYSFFMPSSNVTIAVTFEQIKPFLGGGYQNAKWGMTVDQVKSALISNRIKANIEVNTSDGDKAVRFIIDGQKELTCFFYNNKFYHAEYDPKLKAHEEDVARAILNEMITKYGNGRTYRGTNNIGLIYYVTTEWEDIETKIIYQIHDKQVMMYYVAGSVIVAYTCKAIEAQKDADKERAANEAKQKRLRSFEGDL
jgi:hypothetical protein